MHQSKLKHPNILLEFFLFTLSEPSFQIFKDFCLKISKKIWKFSPREEK